MHQTILEHLQWRYATKSFDPARKISDKDWEIIEETLRLSPSSYGLQPWKFIVVTSAELKKQLLPATWNQPQVTNCDRLVVLTHKKKIEPSDIDTYLTSIAQTRGISVESLNDFKVALDSSFVQSGADNHKEWTAKQTYIAMGTSLMAAALLKIDACPMEGLSKEKYDEILGLTNYTTSAAIAFGYRASDDYLANLKKVRYAKEQIIQHR